MLPRTAINRASNIIIPLHTQARARITRHLPALVRYSPTTAEQSVARTQRQGKSSGLIAGSAFGLLAIYGVYHFYGGKNVMAVERHAREKEGKDTSDKAVRKAVEEHGGRQEKAATDVLTGRKVTK